MRARVPICLLLTALTLSPIVAFAQAPETIPGRGTGPRAHDMKHPLGDKQRALKKQAQLDRLRTGRGAGRVHRVANGQYVELEQTRTDRVFVVIAEFGASINPVTGGAPGPRHNEIAQPDRQADNTTIWQADYNRAHYEDMYFRRMQDYYQAQSSGRYGIGGAVVDWVRVPFNEARYGTNLCGSVVCSTVWALVRDAINIWTADQIASGKTAAQVKAELDTFDIWDRYDHDGDGNFDEADGYIDHFQIVHAGEGEETGGGAQGANAIWSHRWYAYFTGIGATGPSFNRLGGTQFGSTGMWVGDYTIQPENGGLGVFAHEYGHDLGLPDNYDTSGGDNSTGFWDLMSSGSYLGPGLDDIGARPGDLTAWDKFQLGWLNYEVSFAGKRSSHKLGPAEANTKQAQGLFTVLPDKVVSTTLADPPAGNYAWYSDKGDNIDTSMTRSISLPAGTTTLSAQLWYDIESDWDYFYASVSTNNGVSWTNLSAAGLTTNTNPNGQNFGNGITGTSNGWVPATFDISAFASQTVLLRFRYWTDGAVVQDGVLIDSIDVGGFTDGAETSPNGWTLSGFRPSTGVETTTYFHAYLSEFRQYRDYDTGLRTGPYNFGFVDTRPNWVEHYPYQDGLLIHYWDTSQTDNDTSVHPGEGLILPIDAHPVPLVRTTGNAWSARVQSYDSPFGLEPTDAITLHRRGVAYSYPSLAAVPVFSDLNEYWSPQQPFASVRVPKTGTAIEVVSTSAQGSFMQVLVRPAK